MIPNIRKHEIYLLFGINNISLFEGEGPAEYISMEKRVSCGEGSYELTVWRELMVLTRP